MPPHEPNAAPLLLPSTTILCFRSQLKGQALRALRIRI